MICNCILSNLCTWTVNKSNQIKSNQIRTHYEHQTRKLDILNHSICNRGNPLHYYFTIATADSEIITLAGWASRLPENQIKIKLGNNNIRMRKNEEMIFSCPPEFESPAIPFFNISPIFDRHSDQSIHDMTFNTSATRMTSLFGG